MIRNQQNCQSRYLIVRKNSLCICIHSPGTFNISRIMVFPFVKPQRLGGCDEMRHRRLPLVMIRPRNVFLVSFGGKGRSVRRKRRSTRSTPIILMSTITIVMLMVVMMLIVVHFTSIIRTDRTSEGYMLISISTRRSSSSKAKNQLFIVIIATQAVRL